MCVYSSLFLLKKPIFSFVVSPLFVVADGLIFNFNSHKFGDFCLFLVLKCLV